MSKDVESSMDGEEVPKLESCGESSDGELSMLPCHTKVVVTGNNRTKSTLIGLQGVVKKAVRLGGWHWLELSNGIEVKLQRNAITVMEARPTHEEDINEKKCHKSSPSHPKIMKKSTSQDSKAKGFLCAPPDRSLKVDFNKLSTASLKRYWQFYNMEESSSTPNPTREQLLDAMKKHFAAEEVDEEEVIAGFVRAINKEKKASK